jgi:acetyltransferase-like isoleucine patch superfamily enzyme
MSIFQRIANPFFLRALKYKRKIEMDAVRRRKNVVIHSSFQIGEQGKVSIIGECKQLRIEKNVSCRRFCHFLLYQNADLIINENVFFNNFCSINCLHSIEIGAGTIFGEGVRLYDHNHKYDRSPEVLIHRDKFSTAPIKIGNNCWIASNVTILKGVTIGDNVIIGANCLIYQSIPANTVVKLNQELTIQPVL